MRTAVSVRRFSTVSARKAYLRRSAPFLAVAMLELTIIGVIAWVLANGRVRTAIFGALLLGAGALAYMVIGRQMSVRHEIANDIVRLRSGAGLDWRFPRSAVAAASPVGADSVSVIDRQSLGPRVVGGDRLVAVMGDAPLVQIDLRELMPVKLRGERAWVKSVVVEADEPLKFASALHQDASPAPTPAPTPVWRPPADAPPFDATLLARGLSRRYGHVVVVEPIDLHVGAGQLVVLLGGNGSGKTTTLRMLAGILRPTTGEVIIGGHRLADDPQRAKERLGYLPDRPALYERLTGREFLTFMAQIRCLRSSDELVERSLEQFGLRAAADTLTSAYSLGMSKKLATAAALIHDPAVLVADEPTSDIDAQAARRFRDLLSVRRDSGYATIVATHDFRVAEAADHLLILDAGRTVFAGSPGELRDKHRRDSLEAAYLAATTTT